MSAPRQLALEFDYRPALARSDFLISDCNRAAFQAACEVTLGRAGQLILTGPEGSGKTHLAAIWAAASGAAVLGASALTDKTVEALMEGGAAVLEDVHEAAADRECERLVFHALNLAAAHGTRLLLTGRKAPTRWGVVTPDLASRLSAQPHIAIGPPDDELLSKILDKLFSDRQISASADAIRFLVPRMERSFAAAARIVQDLDGRALAERRAITRNLVREVYETEPDIIAGVGEP